MLVFSDIHFDLYKAFATINQAGINSRLEQQMRVIQTVRSVARRYKQENIFFLGDLFNSLGPTLPKLLYNIVYYMVQLLAEAGKVYLVVGNHDIYNGLHLFTPFKTIPNVVVIYDTTTLQVEGNTIDVIPWNCPFVTDRHADICFGHFGIQGAKMSDNTTAPMNNEFVSLSLLEPYKLVMAGHFHARQEITNNIHHIGAVMATSFKDSSEDKGVWLVHSHNNYEFIPIPSPKFRTHRIYSSADLAGIETLSSNDYHRILVLRDGIEVNVSGDNVIVEYDLEPRPEEDVVGFETLDSYIPIIHEFIDKSNTQLDKSILKERAIEILQLT